MDRGRGNPRVWALAVAVGIVLADSSIVVLALPDIYRDLDTSVFGVTWVLVSFNLVMALAAVPAAMVARRVGPGRSAAVGLAIFAGAGLACGLSDHLTTLVIGRSGQALGGAPAGTAGPRRPAGRRFFLTQGPLAPAAAVPILPVARHEMATRVIERELRPTGRPHL